MNRKVDCWGGVDGFAERWDGYLVSDTPDNDGRYDIIVTDKEFLDDIGMDEPWQVSALKLGDDYWVGYDDWAWSEPGEVKADENGRLWPEERESSTVKKVDFEYLETVLSFEERFNRILGNR